MKKLAGVANEIRVESGLLVFRLISGEFSRSNVTLQVLMDDMVFPSYTSTKARSKRVEFGESKNCY